MWNLSRHEELEMEILEGLNSIKVLEHLVFCGGTMLRLCHELNRYSVDLDFWLIKSDKDKIVFDAIKRFVGQRFNIKKKQHTKNDIMFEFTDDGYPRHLKIEIRKLNKKIKTEERIAFSQHSPIQVFLKTAKLDEVMRSKVETLLDRAQIRDAFDIEFLLKNGVDLPRQKQKLIEIKNLIAKFKSRDYKVSLGSLLEFKERQYYKNANFRYLIKRIEETLPEKGKLEKAVHI